MVFFGLPNWRWKGKNISREKKNWIIFLLIINDSNFSGTTKKTRSWNEQLTCVLVRPRPPNSLDIWKFKNYEFLFSTTYKLLHIKGQECWQWKKEKSNTITKFIKFITWSPKAPISLRPSKVSSATFSISSFFDGSLLSWIIIKNVHRGEILTHNDYQGWENWLFENMKISNSPYPPPLHPWNLEIHR